PATEDTLLPSEKTTELSDVIGEVRDAVKGLQGARGRLDEIGSEALSLMKSSREAVDKSKGTMEAIQRGTGAIGKLPIIRGYYEDPVALLVRSGSERNRKVFAEGELFEAGRASLTSAGRERLDEVGRWANGLKHKGSDIVIVAYADPESKKGA